MRNATVKLVGIVFFLLHACRLNFLSPAPWKLQKGHSICTLSSKHKHYKQTPPKPLGGGSRCPPLWCVAHGRTQWRKKQLHGAQGVLCSPRAMVPHTPGSSGHGKRSSPFSLGVQNECFVAKAWASGIVKGCLQLQTQREPMDSE